MPSRRKLREGGLKGTLMSRNRGRHDELAQGALRATVFLQRRKEDRRLYSVGLESGFAGPAPLKRDAFAVSDTEPFKSP